MIDEGIVQAAIAGAGIKADIRNTEAPQHGRRDIASPTPLCRRAVLQYGPIAWIIPLGSEVEAPRITIRTITPSAMGLAIFENQIRFRIEMVARNFIQIRSSYSDDPAFFGMLRRMHDTRSISVSIALAQAVMRTLF